MKNSKNTRLYKRAAKVIPGGVNSPVRAFKAVNASPIFIEKAKGPYLYDADGNRYIDYCLSWGPLILGHADKDILDFVKKTMAKGTSFGISTKLEIELAEIITSAFESIENLRLVSSGTEATMTAVRLARGTTGRDKIIKFIGCYHGHVDHLLVKAGSGLATFGKPSSPGVPKDFAKHTLNLPYNQIEPVKKTFEKFHNKIAAIIVEPVAGNMGVIPPKKEFLAGLRKLCTKNNAILIFDEVITGFRLTFGGAQHIYNITPDLTCLGKIIGGGFPLGAVGGKSEIMQNLSPTGPIYQAGTLSGNPVCVAAGIATLKKLKIQKPYNRLEKMTNSFCKNIITILTKASLPCTINRIGSMFTLFFTPNPVTDYTSAAASDTSAYARYFKQMLNANIYLPPSQFEACFLSTTHLPIHIEKTLRAIEKLKL